MDLVGLWFRATHAPHTVGDPHIGQQALMAEATWGVPSQGVFHRRLQGYWVNCPENAGIPGRSQEVQNDLARRLSQNCLFFYIIVFNTNVNTQA